MAPEEWPVVFVDEDVETWFDLDISATECIYQVLVGELRLDPFDDLSAAQSTGLRRSPHD